MAGKPSVGVIVPVRGPATHLEEALRSVLEQDPAPESVVVVDDGSEPAVAADDRCVLVRRDVSGGPAAARQAGLEAVREEWVALCDADDSWEEGKLAAQIAAMRDGVDVVFGSAVAVDAGGRPTGERLPGAPHGSYEGDDLIGLLWSSQPIPASSAVVRRSALVEAGGFPGPAPLASDWDLWLRLAARGSRFVSVPEARVRYRRHAGGVTADLAALAESTLAIRRAHAGLVEPARLAEGEAADLRALARGRIRQRRYEEAREALAEAAVRGPLPPRDRLLRVLVRVPGARAVLGRRTPFRGTA